MTSPSPSIPGGMIQGNGGGRDGNITPTPTTPPSTAAMVLHINFLIFFKA